VMRECPECGHQGLFEATRCGHCWTKLPIWKAKSAN
jgi:hypothetical protein